MNKQRFGKTILILILVGGIFGLAIVFLMKFVDGPVSGKVQSGLSQAKASAAPTAQPPQLLSHLEFSLEYPSNFDQVAQIKSDNRSIVQYSIGSKNDYRVSIKVNLSPSETGVMNEDSSYRLRANDTQNYRATKITGADESVLMKKLDASEQTLFIMHNRKLLIISVTSNSTKVTPAEIMAVVSPSIRWAK